MRLIDANVLKDKVLNWMPSDPCGIAEKERPIETDIVVSLMMEIEEAPTIEPEPHWIPCSERLPEDGVDVLITTENEEVYIDQVITDPYKERYFYRNTGYDNFQVIAWMPLPKPYEGGDDNEERN